MNDYKTTANQNGQRLGQFINNAIQDYLVILDREHSDFEVGQTLFFLSDEELEKILSTYQRVIEARKPVGFTSEGQA